MVDVTFINPITGQLLKVTGLDESTTVREAVQNLVEENLIAPAVNGAYTLNIKGKAMLTHDDATLASGNIATGDTISVLYAQQGGRHD